MKYVRLFEGFKEEYIQAICKEYGIENYTINPDGSIDVSGQGSTDKLTTLKGSPNHVGGNFRCNDNNLTTLKGSPNYVGYNFSCENNFLTTLEGAPNHVGEHFSCQRNNILTFEGAPNYVCQFFCSNNPIFIIWYLFKDYSKVELLNNYDALRIEDGKGICILSRLNGFLEDIGKPKLIEKEIKGIEKYYEIR